MPKKKKPMKFRRKPLKKKVSILFPKPNLTFKKKKSAIQRRYLIHIIEENRVLQAIEIQKVRKEKCTTTFHKLCSFLSNNFHWGNMDLICFLLNIFRHEAVKKINKRENWKQVKILFTKMKISLLKEYTNEIISNILIREF